jgi:hypothetical protein
MTIKAHAPNKLSVRYVMTILTRTGATNTCSLMQYVIKEIFGHFIEEDEDSSNYSSDTV